MGSLNGDVMVMRNGRSTSQISIYNYPEHLNPFYEDDQHKRLRFWKINKKDNEGRRNSFSIGNLKDMWAFKSFRMKKKSSTLGINKTSESPPTLRRDYAVDNGWNTFDHRLRDNNATSLNNDSFQRNATYRSSLQTLPTGNDRIGLNRNDGYRSTIQVTRSNQRYQQQQQQRPQSTEVSHNRRYVYGGSVTPQPLRNSNFGRGPYENDYNVVVRRSSQSSMVSTNPFESDDDENEDINLSGIRSVNGGSTTTLTSRTPRKKRRAPAPPTPIHNRSNAPPPPIIRIESSHDTTNDELRIEEDIDIANLTAEIQSFVETTNNDNVEITQNSNHIEKVSKTTASPKIITTNGEKYETKEDQNSNVKATKSTTEVLEPHEMASVIEENSSKQNISKDLINNSIEEEKKAEQKTAGNITTEVVTVTTTTETKTTPSKVFNKVNKPSEIDSNTNKVSNEIVTKTNESKEIKSNGAIPKKPNNTSDTSASVDKQQLQQQQTITVVDELCIKEINNENVSPKPVPLKRQTKPEPEVGHVECIHVHVESPRATPRKDHTNGISSFKTNESHETSESITTKTPFVLTSPPSQKRIIQSPAEDYPITKETVKILKSPNSNERLSELNINEERINAKPEILVKPTLSPKPILKGSNSKMHGFAEIHKPIRSKYSNSQNGHVRRASRDDSVSPPLVPLESFKENEEKKINNSTSTRVDTNARISETQTEVQLTIVENSNAVANKPLDENDDKQHKEISSETAVKSAKEFLKRDDELDLLYRPKSVTQMEWKRSTLAPLETNIPPEKRKSVKDIIESINRSQRLLNAAANKDFTTLNTTTTNPVVITTQTETIEATKHKETINEIITDETQKIVKRMENDVDDINGAAAVSPSLSPSPSPSPSNSNYNNELADNAQKLDNNDIFQKCKVKKEVYDYRESSPISSNLDWNPVPKPKRTKPGQD